MAAKYPDIFTVGSGMEGIDTLIAKLSNGIEGLQLLQAKEEAHEEGELGAGTESNPPPTVPGSDPKPDPQPQPAGEPPVGAPNDPAPQPAPAE